MYEASSAGTDGAGANGAGADGRRAHDGQAGGAETGGAELGGAEATPTSALPDRDETPAGIYGTIVCASVMAAASSYPVGEVVGTVIVTVLVYWAAERWSEVLGGHLRGEPANWAHAKHVFASGWPMVQASYLPMIIMGGAWLLGASDDVAISIALWTTIGLLGALGSLAGRRGGYAGWGVVLSGVFTAALGAVLVALKALLH